MKPKNLKSETLNPKMMKKKLKWIIPLVIVLILVVACMKRWNAWFGNPIEPPYKNFDYPARIQLTFGNAGEMSRNISWQCGETLEASHVLLVKSESTDTISVKADGKLFETTGGTTVIYWAKLNQLSEGTYSYSVCTGTKQSGWNEFAIRKNPEKFSFIYLGDIQDSIHGETGSFLLNIRRQKSDADFWLLGGDVIERPHDRYWNEYFTSMDSISQRYPVIAIPGNHEYRKGIGQTLDERFVNVFSYFAENKKDNNTVYALNYSNTSIITLDSNRDFWTFSSQKKWFEEVLIQSEKSTWKIVVLHHPIHSIRGKMNNLVVRLAFEKLIEKYNVDLVLLGHEHAYARMISKDNNGNFKTPVYLISNASPKDYRINFNELYDRYGAGMRFYQTVDVHKDTLFIKTFTENNKLYDEVRLIKSGEKTYIDDFVKDIPESIEINSRTTKLKSNKRDKYEQEIREWFRKI